MHMFQRVEFFNVLVDEAVHFCMKKMATKFGFHRIILTTVTLELKITKVGPYKYLVARVIIIVL